MRRGGQTDRSTAPERKQRTDGQNHRAARKQRTDGQIHRAARTQRCSGPLCNHTRWLRRAAAPEVTAAPLPRSSSLSSSRADVHDVLSSDPTWMCVSTLSDLHRTRLKGAFLGYLIITRLREKETFIFYYFLFIIYIFLYIYKRGRLAPGLWWFVFGNSPVPYRPLL